MVQGILATIGAFENWPFFAVDRNRGSQHQSGRQMDGQHFGMTIE
jgi:hypothetical protein